MSLKVPISRLLKGSGLVYVPPVCNSFRLSLRVGQLAVVKNDMANIKLESDPTTIIKMSSGYACMGNTQFLPGYCLLFADPEVPDLTDLDPAGRAAFLLDMGLLGEAIMSVYKPLRINYGILGNSHPRLHAHLYPRYDWEPDELRTRNVWLYPDESWTAEKHRFDEARHGDMKSRLGEILKELMRASY